MKIQNWQKQVDQWIKEYGVRYFDIKTNALILSEEVGEFNRLIARKYGEQSFKKKLSKKEIEKNLKSELGDILFVTTCIANQLDIDLTDVLKKNLKRKTKRDHSRHKNNDKLSG